MTELGKDGGDAADADVVLLAVPDEAVPDALASVTGLHGKVVLDATNRVGVVEHLENAAAEEDFAKLLVAMVRDAGDGPLFYRFAAPQNF